MIKVKDEPPMEEKKSVSTVEESIDAMLEGRSPSEVQRVKDNRVFIKKIHDTPIPKEKELVRVFGVRDVNLNAILKDNIWHRGIFTVDHLCREAFSMTLEQQKKYLAQKRKKPFEHWWLILLMGGAAAAIIIILILMNVDLGSIF